MSCKLSEKCDNVFACNILRPNVELLGCNFYKPKKPMTNEEWFCSLSTEKKVEFSMRVFKNCTWCLDGGNPQECPFNAFLDCPAESKENMMKWLKGIHT